VGRRGATSSHVKNLTAQTWRSTRGWSLGIDPTASTATHSSFIEVPSTSLQVGLLVVVGAISSAGCRPVRSSKVCTYSHHVTHYTTSLNVYSTNTTYT